MSHHALATLAALVSLTACTTNAPAPVEEEAFGFTRTKADGASVEESIAYRMEGGALALVYQSELGEQTLYVRTDYDGSALTMEMDDGRALALDFATDTISGEPPPQAFVDALTLMVEENGAEYGVTLEDTSADSGGTSDALLMCDAVRSQRRLFATGALLCAAGIVGTGVAVVSGVGVLLPALFGASNAMACAAVVELLGDFGPDGASVAAYCDAGPGTLSVAAAELHVFGPFTDTLTLTLTASTTPPQRMERLTVTGRVYDRDGTELETWTNFPFLPEGTTAGMPFQIERTVPRIAADGFAIVELSGEAFHRTSVRLECRSSSCTVL